MRVKIKLVWKKFTHGCVRFREVAENVVVGSRHIVALPAMGQRSGEGGKAQVVREVGDEGATVQLCG